MYIPQCLSLTFQVRFGHKKNCGRFGDDREAAAILPCMSVQGIGTPVAHISCHFMYRFTLLTWVVAAPAPTLLPPFTSQSPGSSAWATVKSRVPATFAAKSGSNMPSY